MEVLNTAACWLALKPLLVAPFTEVNKTLHSVVFDVFLVQRGLAFCGVLANLTHIQQIFIAHCLLLEIH